MAEKDILPKNENSNQAEAYLKKRYTEMIWGVVIMLFLAIAGYIFPATLKGLAFWKDIQAMMVVAYVVVVFVWYGLIQFWYDHFLTDKAAEKNRNPFRKMFFGSINVISLILLAAGLFISFVIMSDGKFFLAIASFIAVVWTVVFLRYFMWSVYFYNINYGLTDLDWEKIFQKRDSGKMPESEINAPKENPYRDQTFGLPPGTVRGMIAFTLLFGGLALLLASMDMSSEINGSSYYADHFEFFKTAFLMMIAFYFGDSSLKYLSKKWGRNVPELPNDKGEKGKSEAAIDVGQTTITNKKKALQSPTNSESGGDASVFE